MSACGHDAAQFLPGAETIKVLPNPIRLPGAIPLGGTTPAKAIASSAKLPSMLLIGGVYSIAFNSVWRLVLEMLLIGSRGQYFQGRRGFGCLFLVGGSSDRDYQLVKSRTCGRSKRRLECKGSTCDCDALHTQDDQKRERGLKIERELAPHRRDEGGPQPFLVSVGRNKKLGTN